MIHYNSDEQTLSPTEEMEMINRVRRQRIEGEGLPTKPLKTPLQPKVINAYQNRKR